MEQKRIMLDAMDCNNKPMKVWLMQSEYSDNGNIAVIMLTEDGERYATLTVNITPKEKDCAAIDTNNYPQGMDFIEKNHLGEKIGEEQSGYCTYPVVRFDRAALDKVAIHEYEF